MNLHRDYEIAVADGVEVRVTRQDDHLRMICLHFLGHGAMRPLWLCDIALLMESRGPDFDWDRVLGKERRQREWVITTLVLAHELLGARIDDTPIANRAGTLPRWLAPAVLKRWETANGVPHDALAQITRGPQGFVEALRARWPDPVTATVRTHAPLNGFPRFPLQCAAWLIRVAQYAIWRLPGQAASLRETARARTPAANTSGGESVQLSQIDPPHRRWLVIWQGQNPEARSISTSEMVDPDENALDRRPQWRVSALPSVRHERGRT